MELKSYKLISVNGISGKSQFVQQFKAYTQNSLLENLDDLSYSFDARKLVRDPNYANNDGLFETAGDAVNHVREQFRIFMGNADNQVFETIWSNDALRKSIWPDLAPLNQGQIASKFAAKKSDFLTRLGVDGSLDDVLLSFIKVE